MAWTALLLVCIPAPTLLLCVSWGGFFALSGAAYGLKRYVTIFPFRSFLYVSLCCAQSNDNINTISADWPSITFGIRVGDDGAGFFFSFFSFECGMTSYLRFIFVCSINDYLTPFSARVATLIGILKAIMWDKTNVIGWTDAYPLKFQTLMIFHNSSMLSWSWAYLMEQLIVSQQPDVKKRWLRLDVLLRWSPTVIGCLGYAGLIILQAGVRRVRQNRPGCWRVNSKWNRIII